jgi:hypothetical protein
MNIYYDEKFQQQRDCLNTSVQKYIAAGNLEGARRLVIHSHEEYSRISCEYWRNRWLSTLDESIELLQQRGAHISFNK